RDSRRSYNAAQGPSSCPHVRRFGEPRAEPRQQVWERQHRRERLAVAEVTVDLDESGDLRLARHAGRINLRLERAAGRDRDLCEGARTRTGVEAVHERAREE